MRKRWLLLFVAVLLLAGAVVTRSLGTSGGLLYVSVDLRNAPFEEALRQLFSGPMLGHANYVVESGPAEGAAATIRLGERTKAADALTQVLGQYGLRYHWVGATVYIFREGERPQPEEGLLLYLRRNGDRTQLRLRAYPYERGGEKLLWESPKDVSQDAYILPSPCMGEETASRPTDTPRGGLVSAFRCLAAAVLGYVCYWFVAGALLEGLTPVVAAILRPRPAGTAGDVLFGVCGLLGGLLAGAVAALLWPARRMILAAALLGSATAWEEMARPLGYPLVLRTPPVVAELVAFLVGTVISHGLVSRRVTHRPCAR